MQDPRKRWHAYLQAARAEQTRAPIRFLIYCQGRTGSSLLTRLLHQHPQVYCDGELFNPNFYGQIRRPYAYVDGCAAAAADGNDAIQAYGFKLKFYELTELQRAFRRRYDVATFLQTLHAQGWRFIHLQRRDKLAHAYSTMRLLDERRARLLYAGAYLATGRLRRARRALQIRRALRRGRRPYVTVDPKAFVRHVQQRQAHDNAEPHYIQEIPTLHLEYERDLADAAQHQATMDRVFAHFGLTPIRLAPDKPRGSAPRLRDNIRNYDEVVAQLHAAGLDHLLPPQT